jgi:hypothetical protein
VLDSRFYGIGRKQLMHFAFEYAEKNNIPHRFNKVTKAAGRHWVQDFCKKKSSDSSGSGELKFR